MYKHCCEYYKKSYLKYYFCPICGTRIRAQEIYKLKNPNKKSRNKYIIIKPNGVNGKHETKIC